jgi:LPXTG-motif cell wall-anchored protein
MIEQAYMELGPVGTVVLFLAALAILGGGIWIFARKRK